VSQGVPTFLFRDNTQQVTGFKNPGTNGRLNVGGFLGDRVYYLARIDNDLEGHLNKESRWNLK